MSGDPVALATMLGSRPLLLLAALLGLLAMSLVVVAALVGWASARRAALWQLAARAFRWLATRPLVARLDARFPALRRALASFDPYEYVILHTALALAIVVAALVFLKIGDSVTDDDTLVSVDLAFAASVHRSASPFGVQVLRAFTFLGGGWALTIFAVVVCLVLVRKRKRTLAVGWTVALAGVGILNSALKAAFARPRPVLDPPHDLAAGWSFPSGHSMGTFVAAGMVAYLALLSARTRPRAWLVVAAASAWTLAMGFSRLYLGVHYLSDVVGGFAAGTVWLAACVSGIEIARRA